MSQGARVTFKWEKRHTRGADPTGQVDVLLSLSLSLSLVSVVRRQSCAPGQDPPPQGNVPEAGGRGLAVHLVRSRRPAAVGRSTDRSQATGRRAAGPNKCQGGNGVLKICPCVHARAHFRSRASSSPTAFSRKNWTPEWTSSDNPRYPPSTNIKITRNKEDDCIFNDGLCARHKVSGKVNGRWSSDEQLLAVQGM